MTWQYPWAISGLTELPLDVARVFAYAATGGGEGVVGAGDLQVKQLGTPGTSVNVLPGAMVCLNRFSANSNQSYVASNVGNDTIAVTATGGSGRTDLVYANIIDPGQPGNPTTASVAQTKIIQNVSPSVRKLSDVPGYTNVAGLALALITLPASTATITDGMITDLRTLVTPNSQRKLYVATPASNQALTSTTMTAWPLNTQTVYVPTWATKVKVIVYVNGAQFAGNTLGLFGVKFGSLTGANVIYDATTATTDPQRINIMAASEFAVDAATRGTNVVISTQGNRASTGYVAINALTSGTNIIYDVQFDQDVTVA